MADGTRCDDGRVCQSRMCVPLTSVVCPTGSNGLECSGPNSGVSDNYWWTIIHKQNRD